MTTIELVELINHVDVIEIENITEVIDVTGGPVGPPGGGTGYVHYQSTASDTWTVVHHLGYKPAGIQLWDSGGSPWTGLLVTHVDDNVLTIYLPFPFSGYSIHS